eukprot:scaffold326709_cov59-Tisochrysis_lutea.AAC.2
MHKPCVFTRKASSWRKSNGVSLGARAPWGALVLDCDAKCSQCPIADASINGSSDRSIPQMSGANSRTPASVRLRMPSRQSVRRCMASASATVRKAIASMSERPGSPSPRGIEPRAYTETRLTPSTSLSTFRSSARAHSNGGCQLGGRRGAQSLSMAPTASSRCIRPCSSTSPRSIRPSRAGGRASGAVRRD